MKPIRYFYYNYYIHDRKLPNTLFMTNDLYHCNLSGYTLILALNKILPIMILTMALIGLSRNLIFILLLILIFCIGYIAGRKVGYKSGYNQGISEQDDDQKKLNP